MSAQNYSPRYQRQMLLPGFGQAGQNKLSGAKVLVVGAGGLGCPAMLYLAAAGVGTIGIADHDHVSLSNLQRQVIYTIPDIGALKAVVASHRLRELNPDINIIPHAFKLTNQNALEVFKDYDIIIDGTDNFPTRYMVNDACVLLGKALVYGAISQFEGQLCIFNVPDDSGTKLSYRDIFPTPPKENEVLNCAEAGVIGTLPGIIGSMLASETIKLITGLGFPLINRLFVFNSLNNQTYEMSLQPSGSSLDKITGLPQDEEAFRNMDYPDFCGLKQDTGAEIDSDFFNEAINNGDFTIIDVRESGEEPIIDSFNHVSIPLSRIKQSASELPGDKIILFCQSGKRSMQALHILQQAHPGKEIYSLKGGIVSHTFQNE